MPVTKEDQAMLAFQQGATPVMLPAPECEFVLTKREYFAGLAMQGMLAASFDKGRVANWAVECADHLIAKLTTLPTTKGTP